MAELADALDLGSSAVKGVQVQVLFPAPLRPRLPRIGLSPVSSEQELQPPFAGSSLPIDFGRLEFPLLGRAQGEVSKIVAWPGSDHSCSRYFPSGIHIHMHDYFDLPVNCHSRA